MEVTDRRRVTRNRPIELAWSTRRNLLCINDFHPTGRRGRDSAGRGPSLSRCPPGGSLQGKGTAAAAKGRLSVSGSGPLRKQAFDGPETKNSRLLSQPAAVPLSCGESEIRTRDTLLGYTRFPGVPLQPLEHLTAKVIIFSGSASAGGSIFPRGTIKSGYGRCNRGIPRGSG